jgi:murein DD-endopeptidase MepM/ murein hydrolase activator NlpD
MLLFLLAGSPGLSHGGKKSGMFAGQNEYNRTKGGANLKQKGDLMKFLWWKKKFTLMFIAGANRRIVRLKLPEISLYVVPTVTVTVIAGFVLTLWLMHHYFRDSTQALQKKYTNQEKQLHDTIAAKDTELDRLQSNLIDLTQQADQFKAKLDEIKKLKNVLNVMTDMTASGSAASKSSASGKATGTSGTSSGTDGLTSFDPGAQASIGGADLPVTDEDVALTVTKTKANLTQLVGDINDLLASLAESEAKLEQAQHLRNITPTLWPTRSHSITSGFGMRRDPFTGKPAMHTGVDLNGDLNDPVYATAEGKVTVAGFDSEHGNHVIINHTRGIETEYMHLNKILVTVGQQISKGQKIGLMGTTGRSTGTHLHYEVHRNGSKIDPTPYLLSDRKEGD